ncbi:MAG: TetR/AcrR family transcriptional regulator C-terminal domain-containing protein [Pseudobutyrivibrio sp.]|nr:TetR/AcrR family transcriptional regulator C-terminal domain-containing protein [Pseudobutyrivibrio sp.]
MATKNNRRIIVTKRILKESLLSLMQEKSISKITIKEICDLSEMSRSTFYLHYRDQFELLKDIEKETLTNSFETLNNLQGSDNTIESIENFLNYIKQNKETFGVLLCQAETEDFQITIINNIADYVKQAIPETFDHPNENYLYIFIMHGSLNVIRSWIKNDFDLPIAKLAELLFSLCNNIAK